MRSASSSQTINELFFIAKDSSVCTRAQLVMWHVYNILESARSSDTLQDSQDQANTDNDAFEDVHPMTSESDSDWKHVNKSAKPRQSLYKRKKPKKQANDLWKIVAIKFKDSSVQSYFDIYDLPMRAISNKRAEEETMTTHQRFPQNLSSMLINFDVHTRVSVVYEQYRAVFCLDLSPSIFTVDPSTDKLYFDALWEGFELFVRNLVPNMSIADMHFHPELHISVIVQGSMEDALYVLAQGYVLNESNAINFLSIIRERIQIIENEWADRVEQSSANATNLSQMLRNAVYTLHSLPTCAYSFIIVLTDGIMEQFDAHAYDGLLMQLNRHDIACHFVQLDENSCANQSFGYIPDNDFLQKIATVTGARCWSLSSLRSVAQRSSVEPQADLVGMSKVQRACFVNTSSFSASHAPFISVRAAHCTPSNTGKHYVPIRPYRFWREKVLEYRLCVDIERIIQVRTTEGFTLHRILLDEQAISADILFQTKNAGSSREEAKALLVFHLAWKEDVWIEYAVIATSDRTKMDNTQGPIAYALQEWFVRIYIIAHADFICSFERCKSTSDSDAHAIFIGSPLSLHRMLRDIQDVDRVLLHLITATSSSYTSPYDTENTSSYYAIASDIIHASTKSSSSRPHPVFHIIGNLSPVLWHRWFFVERFDILYRISDSGFLKIAYIPCKEEDKPFVYPGTDSSRSQRQPINGTFLEKEYFQQKNARPQASDMQNQLEITQVNNQIAIILGSWCSQKLASDLYLKFLITDDLPVHEPYRIQLSAEHTQSIGLCLDLHTSSVSSQKPFCIVKIEKKSYSLFAVHVAFFSASPALRNQTLLDLKQTLLSGFKDVSLERKKDVESRSIIISHRMISRLIANKKILSLIVPADSERVDQAISCCGGSEMPITVVFRAYMWHMSWEYVFEDGYALLQMMKRLHQSRVSAGFWVIDWDTEPFRGSDKRKSIMQPIMSVTFGREIRVRDESGKQRHVLVQYALLRVSEKVLLASFWMEPQTGLFTIEIPSPACFEDDVHSIVGHEQYEPVVVKQELDSPLLSRERRASAPAECDLSDSNTQQACSISLKEIDLFHSLFSFFLYCDRQILAAHHTFEKLLSTASRHSTGKSTARDDSEESYKSPFSTARLVLIADRVTYAFAMHLQPDMEISEANKRLYDMLKNSLRTLCDLQAPWNDMKQENPSDPRSSPHSRLPAWLIPNVTDTEDCTPMDALNDGDCFVKVLDNDSVLLAFLPSLSCIQSVDGSAMEYEDGNIVHASKYDRKTRRKLRKSSSSWTSRAARTVRVAASADDTILCWQRRQNFRDTQLLGRKRILLDPESRTLSIGDSSFCQDIARAAPYGKDTHLSFSSSSLRLGFFHVAFYEVTRESLEIEPQAVHWRKFGHDPRLQLLHRLFHVSSQRTNPTVSSYNASKFRDQLKRAHERNFTRSVYITLRERVKMLPSDITQAIAYCVEIPVHLDMTLLQRANLAAALHPHLFPGVFPRACRAKDTNALFSSQLSAYLTQLLMEEQLFYAIGGTEWYVFSRGKESKPFDASMPFFFRFQIVEEGIEKLAHIQYTNLLEVVESIKAYSSQTYLCFLIRTLPKDERDRTTLLPFQRRVLKNLKQKMKEYAHVQVLELLRATRQILDPVAQLVNELMHDLPESLVVHAQYPLEFVCGKELWEFAHDLLRQELAVRIKDLQLFQCSALYFVVDEELQIPYWAYLSIHDTHIALHALFPETLKSWRLLELTKIHVGILRACTRVNQQILLSQLHETRTCNALLLADAVRSKQAEEEEHANSMNAFFWPGQFACPQVYGAFFKLHDRLAPHIALHMLCTSALEQFQVHNRRHLFVYRDRDGHVFYMKISQSDRGGATDTLPCNKALQMEEGLMQGVAGIFLQVFGIYSAGEEVTHELCRLLERKLDEATQLILMKLLGRNAKFQLSHSDFTFLCPSFEHPQHRFEHPLPLRLRNSRLLYFFQLVLMHVPFIRNTSHAWGAKESLWSRRGSRNGKKKMIESAELVHPSYLSYNELSIAFREALRMDSRLYSPVFYSYCRKENSAIATFVINMSPELSSNPSSLCKFGKGLVLMRSELSLESSCMRSSFWIRGHTDLHELEKLVHIALKQAICDYLMHDFANFGNVNTLRGIMDENARLCSVSATKLKLATTFKKDQMEMIAREMHHMLQKLFPASFHPVLRLERHCYRIQMCKMRGTCRSIPDSCFSQSCTELIKEQSESDLFMNSELSTKSGPILYYLIEISQIQGFQLFGYNLSASLVDALAWHSARILTWQKLRQDLLHSFVQTRCGITEPAYNGSFVIQPRQIYVTGGEKYMGSMSLREFAIDYIEFSESVAMALQKSQIQLAVLETEDDTSLSRFLRECSDAESVVTDSRQRTRSNASWNSSAGNVSAPISDESPTFAQWSPSYERSSTAFSVESTASPSIRRKTKAPARDLRTDGNSRLVSSTPNFRARDASSALLAARGRARAAPLSGSHAIRKMALEGTQSSLSVHSTAQSPRALQEHITQSKTWTQELERVWKVIMPLSHEKDLLSAYYASYVRQKRELEAREARSSAFYGNSTEISVVMQMFAAGHIFLQRRYRFSFTGHAGMRSPIEMAHARELLELVHLLQHTKPHTPHLQLSIAQITETEHRIQKIIKHKDHNFYKHLDTHLRACGFRFLHTENAESYYFCSLFGQEQRDMPLLLLRLTKMAEHFHLSTSLSFSRNFLDMESMKKAYQWLCVQLGMEAFVYNYAIQQFKNFLRSVREKILENDDAVLERWNVVQSIRYFLSKMDRAFDRNNCIATTLGIDKFRVSASVLVRYIASHAETYRVVDLYMSGTEDTVASYSSTGAFSSDSRGYRRQVRGYTLLMSSQCLNHSVHDQESISLILLRTLKSDLGIGSDVLPVERALSEARTFVSRLFQTAANNYQRDFLWAKLLHPIDQTLAHTFQENYGEKAFTACISCDDLQLCLSLSKCTALDFMKPDLKEMLAISGIDWHNFVLYLHTIYASDQLCMFPFQDDRIHLLLMCLESKELFIHVTLLSNMDANHSIQVQVCQKYISASASATLIHRQFTSDFVKHIVQYLWQSLLNI